MAIGLIAISQISSLNCSWLQVFPHWKVVPLMSKMCGVIGSVLFLKMLCALYSIVYLVRIQELLQLITWVVLGSCTGTGVIQNTPGHVLLKIIFELLWKKSLKFGNAEAPNNELL
jgi:hypothetical protein